MDIAATDLAGQLQRDGFAFLHGTEMRAEILRAEMRGVGFGPGLADWDAFAASWDHLGLDTYMADGGRYRKRRHAAFLATQDGIRRKPHQPHYQSRDYNALNGGIARWFEPILPEIAEGATFRTLLGFCGALFNRLTPMPAWHVEAHQFRIEARSGAAGQPTPEGMHQDGVDWVLVLLVARRNIASGTTSVHGLDRRPLGSFTLEEPLDAALVDDHRVMHGVTPVVPSDPAHPGHRDVLVLTWRRETVAPG